MPLKQAFSADCSSGFRVNEFPMCELCSVNSVLVHRGCYTNKQTKQENKTEKKNHHRASNLLK